jgi:hypothetical protein
MPTTTLRSAEDHYRDVQRLAALAVLASRRSWRKLDLRDLDGSFASTVGPELLIMLASAQQAAASLAEPYVDRVLIEQNFGDDGRVARFVPGSLVGVASDGRPLPSLLRSPLTNTKMLIAQGSPEPIVATVSRVERIVATQVQDAARAAESAVIASRAKVGGYVRQLTPPSCSRCAILAGRWYRYNTGFQRHPHCDCVHIPAAEDAAGDLVTNPRDYFDSLTPAQQDAIFTKSGAKAIRDGADIGQVVNARRGMFKAQELDRRSPFTQTRVNAQGRVVNVSLREYRDPVFGARVTNEGITRRGFATNAPGSTVAARGGVRLMPETIYQVATSRADAIRLLRANGYLR